MSKFLALAWLGLVVMVIIATIVGTIFEQAGLKGVCVLLGIISFVAITIWAINVLDPS